MFTIDQKEQITRLIVGILHGVNRADAIADGTPVDEVTKDVYIKDVLNALDYARSRTQELKDYLMGIDKEENNGVNTEKN